MNLNARSFFVSAAVLTFSVLAPSVVHAQDTAPSPEPPAAPAAPAAPAVRPAPPPAAPGAIVKTSGDYACAIVERGELTELEARTAADIICGELVKQKARTGRYEISFGRLGSRTRLVIASGEQTREAWLLSLDELQAAAARTVEALSTGRSVGDTENVDNVLASEATTRRTKPGQLGAGASLIGATTVGASSSLSTGFGLALQFNTSRYSVLAEARAIGIGSSDEKLAELSAGIGGRVFFSDADFSPFAGGGLQVVYDHLTKSDASGSGAGAFGEVGLAGLRSNKVGVQASVRGALPFFQVADAKYVVPVTLNLGLTFL